MEKTGKGWRPNVYVVLLLGSVAFSCCVAAEFKKAQVEDMEVDGSLCSMPRSSAFGLGIAAVVCLSITQVVGTSVAATGLCSWRGGGRGNNIKSSAETTGRKLTVPITFLVLSWLSFGLAMILLGTGSSMSDRQPYGKGWLDGDCYVVKDGVYSGAAVLVIVAVVFVLGFTFSTRGTTAMVHRLTGPEEIDHQEAQVKDGV